MQSNRQNTTPDSSVSENFGNIPKASESFRNVRNDSESFRSLRNASERKSSHTLSVREATRMFEIAGVPRTERSIINWCNRNRQEVARLDSYFDENERRHFITQESVERAIQEELAKGTKTETQPPPGPLPNASERKTSQDNQTQGEPSDVKGLQQEIMDLKITNRGKDYFIEQLQKEREAFGAERNGYIEKLMGFHRKVGELETALKQQQLGTGTPTHPDDAGQPVSAG